MIDTHCHLDDSRFAADFTEVLPRATSAGVSHMLTIGVDLATSRAAVEIAEKYPQIFAVVGIQPNYVAEAQAGDIERIAELAQAPANIVVGIGETGLDRHWDRTPYELQEVAFLSHLQLARRLNLPVVIHCREAEADVVRVLRDQSERTGPIRGVMHSFCGDDATMSACLELGLHISFAGMLTYKTAANLRALAAKVPADRLLIETDAPYLAPVPMRGRRNEPAFVRHTAECLAACRGVSFAEIARITSQNAASLFGLPAH